MDVQPIVVDKQIKKTKIMGKYAFLLLVILFSACSDRMKQQSDDDVKLLKIDWGHISDAIDYSSMVEDGVVMIPLETKDDCVIGEVTKLIYQNNLFYIADNMSKSIFVFDKFGKLKSKIHAAGNGPGEYTNISYFTVHGTDMILFDHYMGKFLFYDASGKFIRDRSIGDIWAEELFCIGDKLYLTNTSKTKAGCYKLFTIDLKNSDKIEEYLSFDEPKQNTGFGEDSYALLGNEALVCFFPYDELYTVKDGEVFLSYQVDFGDKRLPKQYIDGDGTTALRTAFRDNYVTGISRFWQSEQYLFLSFGDSEKDYMTIYNKKTGEMQTTQDLQNDQMGNLILQTNGEGFIIQDEQIIQCFRADYWNHPETIEQYESNHTHFYTEELRQKFLKLAKTDGTESNPIILIQKLKK